MGARHGDLMRIGLLFNLAPRKLGSLEDWVVAFAQAGGRRGHSVTVFGDEPIHPEVLAELHRSGAGWQPVSPLLRRPWAFVRQLSRDYDVLHLNLFPPRGIVPLVAYLARSTPVIFVDHFSGHGPQPSRARAALRWTLDTFAAARIAVMVGVSDYVSRRAEARFGSRLRAVETIHGGVRLERFAPPERRSGDGLHVAAVSNLIPEKGLEVLLRAAARCRAPLRISVAGDGPDGRRLEALAETLGIADRVSFLGLRNDVDRLLREADVFVHPALWDEAFGLTVAEAMASGCPVVASRVGAIPELMTDGEHGLLFRAGSVDELSATLDRLVGDAALRERLGRNARSRIVERFGIDRSVGRHLDLCEKIHRASG